jgi:hypothetical protein
MRYVLLSLPLVPTLATAQCPFDPTIEPTSVILCPNEQMELTTQAYDGYQWYKDGSIIPGATGQTYTVDYTNDGGSEFTVEGTLNGCTEMSTPVLVDGWMFLLPYVIHGGDEPYDIGPNGESYLCEGDTLTLSFGMPYTENITWYRNGQVIDGENDITLVITTSGSYTGSAAPSVCPNSVMHLGVDVDVFFTAPIQPVIIPDDAGQLCAYPAGNSHQWYLDGTLIPGADEACIIAGGEGTYTVFVDYGSPCQVISDPHIITRTDAPTGRRLQRVAPNPATDRLHITLADNGTPVGAWTISDLGGRTVLQGSFTGSSWIDISSLASGTYTLRLAETETVPLRFIKK